MNTLKTILITLLLTSTTLICAQDMNVFLGDLAGTNTTTGKNNTFLGYATGHHNTAGKSNTFSGSYAGYENTTGYNNTFSGHYAGRYNISGKNNTFLGFAAGYRNTTGYNNTFSGNGAGYYNTTGKNNTFSGAYAGNNNTSGRDNTFSGHYTGRYNTTGSYNMFSGYSAGYQNTTGSYNVFSGNSAGQNTTTGGNNTYIGYQAGYTNSDGVGNVFLGHHAGYNEQGSNKLYISNTDSETPLIYGDFETKHIGIGTTTPTGKFDVTSGSFSTVLTGNSILFSRDNGPAYIWSKNKEGYLSFGTDGRETSIANSNLVLKADFNSYFNGNLGIGTANPDEKLTVKGKIHAEEIRVDLSVPADYVFQKYYTGTSLLKDTYKMPTLEEVAAFTKKNHHLPAIPSATQIQKEGLHLKEMTNLLLQKIEELTIYTIEQEKRIKTLESKLSAKKS